MLRPCECRACKTCDLYDNGPDDHPVVRAWKGLPPLPQKPKPAARPPCAHLGEPTGEVALCGSCSGSVKLKLHTCAVHKHCTLGKKAPGLACCVGCPAYASSAVLDHPFEFVRTAQLIADAIALAAKLPADVTAVAGVPRSGIIPASVIATHLHLPLYAATPAGELTRLMHGGRGSTLARHSGWIAVIDDTVYSGAAMRRIKERRHDKALYAAVYARPAAVGTVDVYAKLLPSPHLLEWNICNGGPFAGHAANKAYRKGIGLDLDGVIVHDADSGGSLLGPYLVPRSHPCKLIATGRRERHRAETEALLSKVGARWERLEMLPDSEPDTVEAIARHKAKHFLESGLGFFVESCPIQAELISELSGLPVVCPRLGKVFQRARDAIRVRSDGGGAAQARSAPENAGVA